MIKFIRDCIPALLVLLFCSALSAQEQPQWNPPQPVVYTSTCVSDATDLTTYSIDSTTTAPLGSAFVVVGWMAEDGAATYTLSSSTINSVAAEKTQDNGGNSVVISSGFIQSVGKVVLTSATINVGLTFSEAVTSATVCVWVIANLDHVDLEAYSSFSGDYTGGSLESITHDGYTPGFSFGVSANSVAGATVTWTGLTEIEDTQDADKDYSNSAITFTPGTIGGAPLTVSVDWTNSNAGSLSTVSYGVANRPPLVKHRADCVTSTSDLTTYTLTATFPTVSATTPVVFRIFVLGEDAAATFGVSSVTADGVSMSELVDGDGAFLVSVANYGTTTEQTGADSVDFVVTFSEAVLGAGVCAWAFENASVGGLATNSITNNVDSNTDSSAANGPGQRACNGYMIAAAINQATGDNNTWVEASPGNTTGGGEVEDGDNADFAYSTYEATCNGLESSKPEAAFTLDGSGTNDFAAGFMAFGR